MRLLNKKINRVNNSIVQFACKSCACDAGCNCNVNITPPPHINTANSVKNRTNDIFKNNNIELK